jgi:SAM-dependent methyltransferase
MTVCKLCLASSCVPAGQDRRPFCHCPDCGLIFVPEAYWLTAEQERDRYAHHDNRASNPGYRTFLGQVADVVVGLGTKNPRILDFGSGENAVLADILRDRGLACVAYDPLYGREPLALRQRYDVVVVCEVIEHLRQLRQELLAIRQCLNPDARIVVRTQCYPSVAGITSWWYTHDTTHINFFSQQALDSAAGLCGRRSRCTSQPDIFIWAVA